MLSCVYKIATLANSATPVIVPEKTPIAHQVDVDAMLAAVTPKTRMVYIANPNNPTGSYLTRTRCAACMPACRRDCAAGDRRGLWRICAGAMIMKTGIELVSQFDNVVMTRTFSKIHGLAGLRIGWVYAPGCGVRRAQPHPRAVQYLDACSSAPARRRSATAPMSNALWRITRNGETG